MAVRAAPAGNDRLLKVVEKAKVRAGRLRGQHGGSLEALRATGAGAAQTIVFSVLPQVLPAWIAVTLYRFETNLRQATILGMVGAGGIGFELIGSMKLFQYQDTATCILVIVTMVMAADFISSRLRARIHGGAR